MEKEEWIAKIRTILASPRNEKNAIEFHELVYEAPIAEGQEVVDLLLESFLDPFDSSVMQGCITVLSGVGTNEYYEACFKIIRELLKIRETSTAIDLLDYPGHELDDNEIKDILMRIKQISPSGELKGDIDHLIKSCNLENDHPYSEIYFSN